MRYIHICILANKSEKKQLAFTWFNLGISPTWPESSSVESLTRSSQHLDGKPVRWDRCIARCVGEAAGKT